MLETQTELYRGVTIIVTPILNRGRKTGTRFTFMCRGLHRQAFTLQGAKLQIDNILAAYSNPLSEAELNNALTSVTNEAIDAQHARDQRALRGGIGDPRSEEIFG